MDLQEKINGYEKLLLKNREQVAIFEEKIEYLKKLSQPTTDEFYANLPTDKYYTIEFEDKKYEFVLGGDVRGSAWSEWREGVVLTVKIRDEYYLTNEMMVALNFYLKDKYKGQYAHIESVPIEF
jgi:hypothetical protein